MINLVFAILLATPIHAHTRAELVEWEGNWVNRVVTEGETIALFEERREMRGKHLWYFAPEEPEPYVRVTDPGTSPVFEGTPANLTWTVDQWRPLVAQYFPADQVDTALRVMACESGGDPWADNPTSSATGLMQILASTWGPHFGYTTAQLFDPAINLYVASLLYYDGGWGHWVCKG